MRNMSWHGCMSQGTGYRNRTPRRLNGIVVRQTKDIQTPNLVLGLPMKMDWVWSSPTSKPLNGTVVRQIKDT